MFHPGWGSVGAGRPALSERTPRRLRPCADRAGPAADRVRPPHRVRIVDATLDCLARQGTAKTTVDDIARRAGVSRATVYRVFPGRQWSPGRGGRHRDGPPVLGPRGPAGGRRRPRRRAGRRHRRGLTRITTHPALTYLVEHEPGVVLGHLAFDESDRLLATATRFPAPFLARWMDPEESGRVAEWAARIVLSYCIGPPTTST